MHVCIGAGYPSHSVLYAARVGTGVRVLQYLPADRSFVTLQGADGCL